MNEEDEIDNRFNNNSVILTKNIMILMLGIIAIILLYAMIQQKEADMKTCVNYMIENWSLSTGMPYYDPERGAIVRPDRTSNLPINISK